MWSWPSRNQVQGYVENPCVNHVVILRLVDGELWETTGQVGLPWWLRGTESVANAGESLGSLVPQSCPTLCDPVDCRLPGSSVHRIFQARVLEWVAISFSRGSSQPRNRTQVSHIVGRHFTIWATREVHRFNPWVRKIPLEEEVAIHFSILAWEIPWTGEPGGL